MSSSENGGSASSSPTPGGPSSDLNKQQPSMTGDSASTTSMTGPPTTDQISAAIAHILESADLAVLSAKRVRKQLEEKFGRDLSSQKSEIDSILMKQIEKIQEENEGSDGEVSDEGAGPSNGATGGRKRAHSDSDAEDDATVAKKLQMEERGYRSRAAKQTPVVKSRAKPKSKARIGGDDEKDKTKKKPNAGYGQECVLSAELSALMGVTTMQRAEVVKRMWEIIKERDLFDPKNKQFVRCDEELLKIFKCKRFRAFGMMKQLKHHVKDPRLVRDY